MKHRTPRIRQIRSKVADPVFASLEARTCACNLQVDNALLVDRRLDGIRGTILIQRYGHIICVKGGLAFVKAVV